MSFSLHLRNSPHHALASDTVIDHIYSSEAEQQHVRNNLNTNYFWVSGMSLVCSFPASLRSHEPHERATFPELRKTDRRPWLLSFNTPTFPIHPPTRCSVSNTTITTHASHCRKKKNKPVCRQLSTVLGSSFPFAGAALVTDISGCGC